MCGWRRMKRKTELWVWDKKRKKIARAFCLYGGGDVEYRDGLKIVRLRKSDGDEFEVMMSTLNKDFENIKSAIQGLLGEIERKKDELLSIDRNTCTDEAWAEVNGEISALEFVEKKIKKWFPDVVEEEK